MPASAANHMGHIMSQAARDLIELRRDYPQSAELRRMALNIIAQGVADQRGGC